MLNVTCLLECKQTVCRSFMWPDDGLPRNVAAWSTSGVVEQDDAHNMHDCPPTMPHITQDTLIASTATPDFSVHCIDSGHAPDSGLE